LTPNSRYAAVVAARAELAREPLYLDTETTGLAPDDQIVEVCVVDHAGGIVFESLVRPTKSVTAGARRVHGIGDVVLRRAPTWAEVWPPLRDALAGSRIAIYNAEFDLRLMRQTHRANQLDWLPAEVQAFCVMELYARYYGMRDIRRGSYRRIGLEDAARQCRIVLPNAHRAKDDALLARALLEYMAKGD
jgi:DNA polymerase-3 subunit epsilon